MGQKVNPIGLRLGIIKTWNSKWYADPKEYAIFLHEDLAIRKIVKKKLYQAGISKIDIERSTNKVKVYIWAARPGLIIGRKGSGIEELKKDLTKVSQNEIFINIQEVRKPEIDAQLIAENIALQLERRVAYRRAMKKGVTDAMKFGSSDKGSSGETIKGIKIECGGRLGGAEMARTERYLEGRVPLHTLRADIDYGFSEAKTTYGLIGIKVWICKGEILKGKM